MTTSERLFARLAAADPLVGAPDDVAGTPWADALLEGVLATDPRTPGGPAARPMRRPALRVAIATALIVALAAGGAYAAYRVLRPSTASERAVDSLSLPAPDTGELAPQPGSMRPLVWTEADGVVWDLWSVRTAGGRTLFVLGSESGGTADGGRVFACAPLAAGAAGSVCGVEAGADATVVVGRVAPGASVREVAAPGADRATVAAAGGAFLVVAPSGVRAVEVLDPSGAVVATLPTGPPDTGG